MKGVFQFLNTARQFGISQGSKFSLGKSIKRSCSFQLTVIAFNSRLLFFGARKSSLRAVVFPGTQVIDPSVQPAQNGRSMSTRLQKSSSQKKCFKMSCARGMKKGKNQRTLFPFVNLLKMLLLVSTQSSFTFIPVNYVEFNFSGARGGVISCIC